jgi:predicted DNA-binding transcriptional regulator YafY
MNIRVFIRLHELIVAKETGTPKQLAQKLEISERSIYYYVSFMQNEMNAPIVYDRKRETYMYEMKCKICFKGK